MELSSVWSLLLSIISESGVWAMLFLALLIVLIKSNNAREEKYQTIIEKLGNSLKKVEEIKEDVEDLKVVAGIGSPANKKQPINPPVAENLQTETTPDKENNNDSQTKSKNL